VFFGEGGVTSTLLYLFAISGLLRAIVAALLARRLRETRKPRKELSAPALVMRITGFDAMLDLLYDFIGRSPTADSEEQDDRKKRASD
jgi:CRP-like cAMP-binding protein